MFETHRLNEQGFKEMKEFKNTMAVAVSMVTEQMPKGREGSIFLTKIEEAVFFGAKAIASKPENHSEIIHYPQP